MTFSETVKKHWIWFTSGAVVLVIAIGLAVAGALGAFTPAEVEAAPPPAVVTPEPAPEPEPTPEPEPLPDPSVDIAETHEMEYSPIWDPPDGGEYFWQVVDSDAGYPRTGGTTFVLAHACESQTCAGDALRTLEPGDTLTFKGDLYRVDSKTPAMKDEIGDLPIWTHVPGRLVLFTCIIETTWDQSDKNEILVTTKVEQ